MSLVNVVGGRYFVHSLWYIPTHNYPPILHPYTRRTFSGRDERACDSQKAHRLWRLSFEHSRSNSLLMSLL